MVEENGSEETKTKKGVRLETASKISSQFRLQWSAFKLLRDKVMG